MLKKKNTFCIGVFPFSKSLLLQSRFANDANQLKAAEQLLYSGIAPLSRKSYNSKINPFVRWAASVNVLSPLSRPLTEADLILYCAHRSNHVNINTIRADLSAIRNYHIERGWSWPDSKNRNKEWPLLARTLRAIEIKQGPKKRDNRKPITLDMLKLMLSKTDCNNFNNNVMIVIMVVALFGLFRISELCNKSLLKQLWFQDIDFKPNFEQTDYAIIKLKA